MISIPFSLTPQTRNGNLKPPHPHNPYLAPYVAIKLSLVDTGKNFNHYLLDTQKLWLANTLRGCKKLKREKWISSIAHYPRWIKVVGLTLILSITIILTAYHWIHAPLMSWYLQTINISLETRHQSRTLVGYLL